MSDEEKIQLIRNIFGSSLMVSFIVVFLLNILVPADSPLPTEQIVRPPPKRAVA